ncbi:hypothetical protein ACH5RR_036401 [Cinchona calisaya]|uniref:Uncharacterized protein n=1 Tax=Cinchona calisaya TaxID=153742 RepID=A0ABD2Y697_9GENT
MTSAIQSSTAVLKEDNAKEAARRDVESKLVMKKLEEGEQVKKHEKEWSGMNFMLNENTRVVYNLGQVVDERGQRYDSLVNHLNTSMKWSSTASDLVVNAILTLVLATTANKIEVPKASI